MSAANKVIAGDYLNESVVSAFGEVSINYIYWNKITIERYEIIDEESRKSAASAIGRGAVGAFFLGPVGLLAGLSAKSKGIHILAIQFTDGKKSLIEVDDEIYKEIMKLLF